MGAPDPHLGGPWLISVEHLQTIQESRKIYQRGWE